MATRMPAERFDLGPATLAAGARADLAIFARDAIPLLPERGRHHQIAFADAALRGRHGIVAGDILVYDDALQTIDERALAAAVRSAPPSG